MPRRDVTQDMQRKSKYPGNVAEDDPVLGIGLSSASQNLEGENDTSLKTAPKALLEERVSTVERAREYSVGPVQGKAVTFALNAPINILAALMGKEPLNSMVSVTVTNRRWGKAVDGTRT